MFFFWCSWRARTCELPRVRASRKIIKTCISTKGIFYGDALPLGNLSSSAPKKDTVSGVLFWCSWRVRTCELPRVTLVSSLFRRKLLTHEFHYFFICRKKNKIAPIPKTTAYPKTGQRCSNACRNSPFIISLSTSTA